MENAEFKKITQETLKEFGFVYCKKNYYCDCSQETIVVINLQKSNFENYYYINYGFCVKAIHKDLQYPRINECDMTGRFVREVGNESDVKYSLETIQSEELKNSLRQNITTMIIPVLNNGIKSFFDMFPNAVSVATLNLKNYLELC